MTDQALITPDDFGAHIRDLREKRKLGLRKFAAIVGMSPTYLSKIERGELGPPGEDKIRAIAAVLELDVDELLALAGRIASDLPAIIRKQPRAFAMLLRSTQDMPSDAINALVPGMRKPKVK